MTNCIAPYIIILQGHILLSGTSSEKCFDLDLNTSSNQQSTQLNLRKWLFLTDLNGRKACSKSSTLITRDVCQNWSHMSYVYT